MTVTIETSKLIDTLTDALQTASDLVGGIHFATARGDYGEEPGTIDLLTATSTDRFTIGHTWIPCDGTVVSSVWPVESAKTVLAICKSLVQKSKEHTVDIDLVTAPPPEDPTEGEHPGWTVTLRETPALFESDTEFQFHAHHEGKFPLTTVRKMLRGRAVDEKRVELGSLTQWNANVLAPLVAVSKRRKSPMNFYRSATSLVQVVTIGPTWIGAACPVRPVPGESTDEPGFDPILGTGSDLLVDTLREMRDAGIEVSVDKPQGPVGQVLGDAAALLRDGSGLVTEEDVQADWDRMLRNAVRIVVGSQLVSANVLEHKLGVGFDRAQRLLEEMEAAGIVGRPAEGAGRTVLFTPDQVDEALAALTKPSEA